MSAPRSAKQLLKKKRRAYEDVPLSLDPQLQDRLNEIDRRLEVARSVMARLVEEAEADSDELATAESRIIDVEQERAALVEEGDGVIVFRLYAVGREVLDDLLTEYQPTIDQLKKERAKAKALGQSRAQADLGFDPVRFPPALLWESMKDGGIVTVNDAGDEEIIPVTEDELTEMWASDDWSGGELTTLFTSAYNLAMRRQRVNLGKDSTWTTSSGSSPA